MIWRCLGCECEMPVQNGRCHGRLYLPMPTQRGEGTNTMFTALASHYVEASAIGVHIDRTERRISASRKALSVAPSTCHLSLSIRARAHSDTAAEHCTRLLCKQVGNVGRARLVYSKHMQPLTGGVLGGLLVPADLAWWRSLAPPLAFGAGLQPRKPVLIRRGSWALRTKWTLHRAICFQ